MFVKVLDHDTETQTEIGLPSIRRIDESAMGSALLTQDQNDTYYSRHPAAMVRKALTLYAAVLSGREKTMIPFPSLLSSNDVRETHSLGGLCLDLTKDNIEISEESAPVDEEGNFRLDATQIRVLRTFSYDKIAARKQAELVAPQTPQIGRNVAGKGIYIGIWSPKDRTGRSLEKTFSVYAAPEDLRILRARSWLRPSNMRRKSWRRKETGMCLTAPTLRTTLSFIRALRTAAHSANGSCPPEISWSA